MPCIIHWFLYCLYDIYIHLNTDNQRVAMIRDPQTSNFQLEAIQPFKCMIDRKWLKLWYRLFSILSLLISFARDPWPASNVAAAFSSKAFGYISSCMLYTDWKPCSIYWLATELNIQISPKISRANLKPHFRSALIRLRMPFQITSDAKRVFWGNLGITSNGI